MKNIMPPATSPSHQSDYMSAYDRLLAWLRSRPEGQTIIAENFLESDLDTALERFCNSSEWLATCQELAPRPGQWVLDCGAGRCLASLAFARLGCRVIALDINPHPQSGLGIVRQHAAFAGQPVYAVIGVGEQLMFPPETFDIVYCREMLHHARNLGLLVQNLARVLKRGATLYATREHRHPWWSSDENFRRHHPAVRFGIDEHSYRQSDYRRAFRQAGLQAVKIRPIEPSADPHWQNAWHHRMVLQLVPLPVVGTRLYRLYSRLRLYWQTGSLITIIGRKGGA